MNTVSAQKWNYRNNPQKIENRDKTPSHWLGSAGGVLCWVCCCMIICVSEQEIKCHNFLGTEEPYRVPKTSYVCAHYLVCRYAAK